MRRREHPKRTLSPNDGYERQRQELVDRTIFWNERQLHALLVEYVDHYNNHRPHRWIDQSAPDDDHLVTPIRQATGSNDTPPGPDSSTSTNPQPEPAHRPNPATREANSNAPNAHQHR